MSSRFTISYPMLDKYDLFVCENKQCPGGHVREYPNFHHAIQNGWFLKEAKMLGAIKASPFNRNPPAIFNNKQREVYCPDCRE